MCVYYLTTVQPSGGIIRVLYLTFLTIFLHLSSVTLLSIGLPLKDTLNTLPASIQATIVETTTVPQLVPQLVTQYCSDNGIILPNKYLPSFESLTKLCLTTYAFHIFHKQLMEIEKPVMEGNALGNFFVRRGKRGGRGEKKRLIT